MIDKETTEKYYAEFIKSLAKAIDAAIKEQSHD